MLSKHDLEWTSDTVARTITPWDGYIELRESKIRFTMRRSERKKLIVSADTMLCDILKSYKFIFTERFQI